MFEQLIIELEKCREIDAVLLGGSRATGQFDTDSDYDLYIYLNQPLSEEKRRKLLDPFVSYMEYSNEFWELEDDGVLKNGIEIELIYRSLDGIIEMMENLLVKGYVSHGYTTCFLDNLIHSKILFDKKGTLQKLKNKYKDGLSDELVQQIVDYNYPIIYDKMPALYKQLEKAVKRGDLHSINHRVSAYFEIYYDILFAINHVTHPGEKRLLTLAEGLPKLPEDFIELVPKLFSVMYHDQEAFMQVLKRLSINLKELLEEEKYI